MHQQITVAILIPLVDGPHVEEPRGRSLAHLRAFAHAASLLVLFPFFLCLFLQFCPKNTFPVCQPGPVALPKPRQSPVPPPSQPWSSQLSLCGESFLPALLGHELQGGRPGADLAIAGCSSVKLALRTIQVGLASPTHVSECHPHRCHHCGPCHGSEQPPPRHQGPHAKLFLHTEHSLLSCPLQSPLSAFP